MIPYGRQWISDDDVSAVSRTLRSDYLTQGPKVTEFEQALSSFCGAEFAVAVNSATSALHIACLALGVGPGDSVWTSPITFVASSNCALYCGAEVDFVDVEPDTGLMCVKALRQKLTKAKARGSLPKVVIPVHFAGQPCDMEEISALGNEFGFRIIEDAAHAIGAVYKGKTIGACHYSDITVFSFHPVKIITSAEGGMALTNSENLARKMRLLSGHGITRDASEMPNETEGEWGYQQIHLGFNYRLSDVHAALGLAQLERLESFVAQRNELAKVYDGSFIACEGLRPLRQKDERRSSYHLYVVLLDQSTSRQASFRALKAAGIGVNVHYIPVYKQPYYQALGFDDTYCNQAEDYYCRAITLPLYPALDAKDQRHVIDTVLSVMSDNVVSSSTGEQSA